MNADYQAAISDLCLHFGVPDMVAEEILTILCLADSNSTRSVLYPEGRNYCIQIIPPIGVDRAWRLIEKIYDYTFAITVYCLPSGTRAIADIELVQRDQVLKQATRKFQRSIINPYNRSNDL